MNHETIWIERMKLKAAFFNNLAVTTFAAGLLVALTGFWRVDEIADWLTRWRAGTFGFGLYKMIFFFVGIVLPAGVGAWLRYCADDILCGLEATIQQE